MPPRGPKPKPTHLKVIEGNRGKRKVDPSKEPQPRAILPQAPAELTADAAAEWERMAAALHAMNLLTEIDRSAFAAYCQAYGRWAEAQRGLKEMAKTDRVASGLMIRTAQGNWIQNPLVGVSRRAASDMVQFAAEFGMTPSARARLGATSPGDAEDPLDGLMWNGGQGAK